MDPRYISKGGQSRAVMSPESLSFADSLFPGATEAGIAGNYGFGAASGCAGCYDDYYNWDPNEHTGIDLATNGGAAPAEFNSLVSGQVICYGGTAGSANPGNNTACGSYPDYGGGGVDGTGSGNLSILTPDGAMVTYGHTDISYADVNDTVTYGTPLGTSGCMAAVGVCEGGYHVHLEVRLPLDGPDSPYVLVDPALYFNGGYCQQGFCPDGMQDQGGQGGQAAPAASGGEIQPGGQGSPAASGGSFTANDGKQYVTGENGYAYQVVTAADGKQYLVDPATGEATLRY
jgi:hypothetical protein